MDTLDGLKTVIAVVNTGSFTAAAEKLGISKGLVSKYVRQIETELDVRIFNRNTRSNVLTDAGIQYYQHALKLLEHYDTMLDDVLRKQSSPKGLLRISCPIAIGEHIISSLLPDFSDLYPEIKVELVLNNRAVNMLQEDIDIRIKSGGVEDSNMIARPLFKWPMIICASKTYLENRNTPLTPDELSEHKCVIDNNMQDGQNWTFVTKNGEQHTLDVQCNLASNNPQVVANIIKAGGGIGRIAKIPVHEELASGELIELFKDYAPMIFDTFLIYPHRKHIPQKVQCFIDFALYKCHSLPN
ncbi:MAG: LysR family transcriptional regulator [Paraglaciecola sp.]|uniref:LysR family transcriptional regulator n=1 Tax=Paraglaciecola sp. TaxID=1920173 RepID=UPI0032994834